MISGLEIYKLGIHKIYYSTATISFPEPTCLLVSTKTVLVLTKRHVGSGNEIANATEVQSRKSNGHAQVLEAH